MIQVFLVNFSFLFNCLMLTNEYIYLDLVFVMDCTGSMGSYIASATNNIRSIVEEIVVSEKSDIRLALVEYRDHPPQVRIKTKQKMF